MPESKRQFLPVPLTEGTPSNNYSVGKCCYRYFMPWLQHPISLGTLRSLGRLDLVYLQMFNVTPWEHLWNRWRDGIPPISIVKNWQQALPPVAVCPLVLPATCWAIRHELPAFTRCTCSLILIFMDSVSCFKN